jgi:hypothetical protein
MCTVKQLKEWLEQFPENTKVKVLEPDIRRWDTSIRHTDLNLEDGSSTWFYLDSLEILYLGDY